VRILLQLVLVLSGLLLAREFTTHSNEHLRRVLRWASIGSENVAAMHEPTSVALVAVGPIAEVSAQSIALVHEAPALVAPVDVTPIAQVSAQGMATVHDEPPALLSPRPVAQIAQVAAQSIAAVRKPPALVATEEVEQIAQVSPTSIGTVDNRPALVVTNDIAQIVEVSTKSIHTADNWPPVEIAPIAAVSVRSIGVAQEQSALAPGMEVAQIGGEAVQSLAPSNERLQQFRTSALAQTVQVSAPSISTVRDVPPPLLAPIAVAPIFEVSAQNIAVDEVPAPGAPKTACERIWDEMTHMSRDEWAEACRRVDELRLVVRNDTSPPGER